MLGVSYFHGVVKNCKGFLIEERFVAGQYGYYYGNNSKMINFTNEEICVIFNVHTNFKPSECIINTNSH